MKKLIKYLMQDEVLKLICGYFIIGSFAAIVVSLFGMIWLGMAHSDYIFPKVFCTGIIIMILSKAGWDVL